MGRGVFVGVVVRVGRRVTVGSGVTVMVDVGVGVMVALGWIAGVSRSQPLNTVESEPARRIKPHRREKRLNFRH